MEFIDLSRYIVGVDGGGGITPFAPSYESLRNAKPIIMTHDLQLHDAADNIQYANQLAASGQTLAKIRRLPAPGSVTDGSFPQRVLFEMTSQCNTNCRMCPRPTMDRAKKHMDTEKFKEIVNEIDAHGVQGLWLFHIGESLLHPDFFELIEHVGGKQNLGMTWLSSNGILLTRDTIKCLLDSKIDIFQMSLPALSREASAVIAPETPYDQVRENLVNLLEMKRPILGKRPFLRLQTIEQNDNRGKYDGFIAEYYNKCDFISINMLEYQSLEFNQHSARPLINRENKKCSRITTEFCLIASDGKVTLCDAACDHELDVGSVYDNTLAEIWQGEARREFVRKNETGELWNLPLCKECNDFDFM